MIRSSALSVSSQFLPIPCLALPQRLSLPDTACTSVPTHLSVLHTTASSRAPFAIPSNQFPTTIPSVQQDPSLCLPEIKLGNTQ
ncbi:hypothetical protein DL98DRAFT_516027 [Cadophora sp. DSE1049]|nr:hypothetical protein DL98DRAFT_516027 [Cadophora sp. DSE1049]